MTTWTTTRWRWNGSASRPSRRSERRSCSPGSATSCIHSDQPRPSPGWSTSTTIRSCSPHARALLTGLITLRNRAEVARFFAGLEAVEPGLTSVAEWRAEAEPRPRPSAVEVSMYGAVARRP
ncbi:SAM-dependent methyltransferase [Micromonospora echinaurantiaca]|uniref:SAM-dependent methyltransferase n=1 Tax=Micromonospora echinaurantiaca TaxID=47857 RepID=UPI003719E63D